MSDPKRLALSSESEVERLLLGAGRVRAPERSRERAFVVASGALGASAVAAGAAGGASAGKGAVAGMAKVGSVLSLKWLGVLSATGIGLVAVGAASTYVVHQSRERAVEPGPSVAPAIVPARPRSKAARSLPSVDGDEWTPAPVDPATLSPAETARTEPATPAMPTVIAPEPRGSSASTVPAELAMLEGARSATAAGDPAGALSLLERYAARFPRGTLKPEATMLRIEALVKAGDRAAATRFAEAFLAGDPDGPYAARVRSLIETANP
jgi:hypothetical protein